MRARISFDALALAFVQTRLVLGMKRRTAADVLEDRAKTGVVRDQEFSGRRAHEHLDARAAGKLLVLGDLPRVFRGAADEECEVAVHPPDRAADLVGEIHAVDRERIGIRHFKDGGDAAHDRRTRAAFQIFLVSHARFAEMNLRVDDPGKNMEPRAMPGLAGGTRRDAAESCDFAVANADIADGRAIVVYDGRAGKNEIVGFGHPAPRSGPALPVPQSGITCR